MRVLRTLLATVLLAGGITVATAAPASAATPTCTGWSTWYTSYSTSYVVHVPTAGTGTRTVNCLLRQGNRNSAVTVLQRALRYCHGYNVSVDGDFGPQTRSAVLAIQRRANSAFGAGIAEDGIYGPQTRDWTHFPVWTWPGNSMTNGCGLSPA
jgi:Putative peptidoglycan binding domain